MLTRDIDAEALLALWERALAAPDAAGDDALLQAGFDGQADADAAAATLGERNLRLAALHARLFGRELRLLSHCPACAAVVEFSGDCNALVAQQPAFDANTAPQRLEVQGHRIDFRLPNAADVAAAAAATPAEDAFVQRLLERCVLGCGHDGAELSVQALPAAVLDTLSARMEALDPLASVSYALQCPQCGTPWNARLDLGQLVRQKLQAAAERVLLDVDTLARTYGWSEAEILRLTPLRRAAYLQFAQAA